MQWVKCEEKLLACITQKCSCKKRTRINKTYSIKLLPDGIESFVDILCVSREFSANTWGVHTEEHTHKDTSARWTQEEKQIA